MRLATGFHCIRLHYLSGVTAVSRTKLSSNYLPLLCGVTNKALQASFSSFPYHKIPCCFLNLVLVPMEDISPLHKYEAVFCCKVFNINTLVYGLLVFSQTMRILVQHKRKFFIKKVLRKCRKSAVFRNFAGEWRFYTYETSTLVKHFQPFFHFKILPRNRLLAFITVELSMVER